jgi:hypothetical protein
MRICANGEGIETALVNIGARHAGQRRDGPVRSRPEETTGHEKEPPSAARPMAVSETR